MIYQQSYVAQKKAIMEEYRNKGRSHVENREEMA